MHEELRFNMMLVFIVRLASFEQICSALSSAINVPRSMQNLASGEFGDLI